MTQQPNRDGTSRWPGWLYATGILLIVCETLATIITAILFMHDQFVHWSGSEACLHAGGAIMVEIIVAGILLCMAEMVARHRGKALTKNDRRGSSMLDR